MALGSVIYLIVFSVVFIIILGIIEIVRKNRKSPFFSEQKSS